MVGISGKGSKGAIIFSFECFISNFNSKGTDSRIENNVVSITIRDGRGFVAVAKKPINVLNAAKRMEFIIHCNIAFFCVSFLGNLQL